MFEGDDDRALTASVVGVEPSGERFSATVSGIAPEEALVEVFGAEGELQRPRPASCRQSCEVPGHRNHRQRGVVLGHVGAVGLALDNDPVRAGARDRREDDRRGDAPELRADHDAAENGRSLSDPVLVISAP
jgi:hypothetical protein